MLNADQRHEQPAALDLELVIWSSGRRTALFSDNPAERRDGGDPIALGDRVLEEGGDFLVLARHGR